MTTRLSHHHGAKVPYTELLVLHHQASTFWLKLGFQQQGCVSVMTQLITLNSWHACRHGPVTNHSEVTSVLVGRKQWTCVIDWLRCVNDGFIECADIDLARSMSTRTMEHCSCRHRSIKRPDRWPMSNLHTLVPPVYGPLIQMKQTPTLVREMISIVLLRCSNLLIYATVSFNDCSSQFMQIRVEDL